MKINVRYITDNKGNHKAVQIPVEEWDRYNKEFQRLKEFKKIKVDIIESFKEILSVETGKRKPRTLNQFLNGPVKKNK